MKLGRIPTEGVWKSGDAAETWKRVLPIGANDQVVALAVDPADPRRVYAGFEIDGVLASGDRGATWRPARSGLRSLGTASALAGTARSTAGAVPGVRAG